MNRLGLALRNIAGSPFRSGVVFVCVMLVAGSGMWASFIIRGAQENLRLSLDSMESAGADLIVVPRGLGYASIGMDNVNLPGLLEELAAIPGISHASPQLHVLTAADSPCCAGGEFFVIAFDPATDFSVLTRLSGGAGMKLGTHEAVAGSLISISDDSQDLRVAGYDLKVLAHLSPTATSLDRSLFITFETAREMFQQPQSDASIGVDINSIPTILVMIRPGSNPHQVSARILKNIPGVSIVDNTELASKQLSGMLKGMPGMLAATWSLSVIFTGVVFAIAVNERQREIGILRVLGSTRIIVYRYLLMEGFLLAFSGGLAGILASILVDFFFREELIRTLNLPLVSSTPANLFILSIVSLGLTFAGVSLAVILPAWRISRPDPVVALRG